MPPDPLRPHPGDLEEVLVRCAQAGFLDELPDGAYRVGPSGVLATTALLAAVITSLDPASSPSEVRALRVALRLLRTVEFPPGPDTPCAPV